MSGYLQRLAQAAVKPAEAIRPMRGSVYAPRAPGTSEAFELEREEVLAPAPQPRTAPAFEAPGRAADMRQQPSLIPYEEPRRAAAAPQAPESSTPASDWESTKPSVAPATRLTPLTNDLRPEPSRSPGARFDSPPSDARRQEAAQSLLAAIDALTPDVPSPARGAPPPSRDAHAAPLRPSLRRAPPSSAPAPADEVRIHIGRIEVTAVPPQRPAPAPPRRDGAFLEDYLRRREGRAG
jgi:hypothetical protein